MLSPEQRGFLAVFAPYLAAGIAVESPAWGRGALLGLPYSELWDRPHAHVRFAFPPPDQAATGVVELGNLRPVLYAPADRVRVLACHPNDRSAFTDVLRLPLDELERMAHIVDSTRALGIALNLSLGAYVRKEVARG